MCKAGHHCQKPDVFIVCFHFKTQIVAKTIEWICSMKNSSESFLPEENNSTTTSMVKIPAMETRWPELSKKWKQKNFSPMFRFRFLPK